MDLVHFQTISGLYLSYLERFNQDGTITVEADHYDLSFAAIRRKVTEQFLSKLGLSGF